MKSDCVIIDGYVDEPACLGVPPYISPYIRTIAGTLAEYGKTPSYVTIDTLRKNPAKIAEIADTASTVVMIAGTTVPGKYLAGTPATLTEIRQLGMSFSPDTEAYLGGPITFGYSHQGGRKSVMPLADGWTYLEGAEPSSALASALSGGEPRGQLNYADYDRRAELGADIIRQHPFYPHVMIELETARGCSRSVTGGCSFCTEPFYGRPQFRSPVGIAAETAALYRAGARHFRLGRQPDLLTYGVSGSEFPKPDPDRLETLFSGIRASAPDLRTLHIDNVNPGTVARHEEAAREALKVIVRYHTAGDTAAFGIESADPAVIAANNLKGSPDEIFTAIETVNEIGAVRNRGIPELLPGLNFIAGLAGETAETFALNLAFLKRISDAGLMVRRVNIRQLMPFDGTRAYTCNTLGKHDSEFAKFKTAVRESFDTPMLEKVFPPGTVLDDVLIEVSGNLSFGRQMGTYPILAGIPVKLETGTVIRAVITAYGRRSVTALPYPIPVNRLSPSALAWIPGISAKTAGKLRSRMPFASAEEFIRSAPGAAAWTKYMDFSRE